MTGRKIHTRHFTRLPTAHVEYGNSSSRRVRRLVSPKVFGLFEAAESLAKSLC